MKKILFVLTVCFSFLLFSGTSFAREFGMLFGYSGEKHLLLDLRYVLDNNIGFKVGTGINLSPGTEGPNLSSYVGWDDYPSHIEKEGSYYNTFNLGVGYYDDFFVAALIGIASRNEYRSCRDPLNILGNYGSYSLIRDAETKLNFGLEAGYSYNFYSFALYWSKYSGFGGKIGFRLKKR